MIFIRKPHLILTLFGVFMTFNTQATLGGAPLGLIDPYTILNQTEQYTSQGIPYQVSIQQNTRGMVLKEFVYQGSVFAQLWFGAAVPNLTILLGDTYYQRFNNAFSQATLRNHRQLKVIDNELTVSNYGRMGDFWGMSYLSNRFPAGFSVNDIQ